MIRPMKAPQKPLSQGEMEALPWPMAGSAKLDGIRAVVVNGIVTSNSGKPLRSKAVQRLFSSFEGLDGELIYGEPNAEGVYNRTTSFVNSTEVPAGFDASKITFWVFDSISHPGLKYEERWRQFSAPFELSPNQQVRILPQLMVYSYSHLLTIEEGLLAEGYEGVMLRRLDAPYKFGRSTLREAFLIKIKRFADAEAYILDYYEEMYNGNAAERNEQGFLERSSAKEGLVGKGRLGGFRVKNGRGQIFDVGGGFTAAQRELYWQNRHNLIGEIIVYKYFPYGEKELPRFPIFKGFRDETDLSEGVL